MSMELAVGLAQVTGRQLVIHYMSNMGDNLYRGEKVPIYTTSRWNNPQRNHLINQDQFPHILDLLEWNDMEKYILIDEKIEKFPQESNSIPDILFYHYFSNEEEISDLEVSFAEGRTRLPFVDGEDIHLKLTLGWYSRFFFNRSKELDAELSSVKFKKEYVELANRIADSLGSFNGAHLRLTDHINMFNTTGQMFENGLQRFSSNLPIVLSTDDPNHEMVKNCRVPLIMLDQYILDNFYQDFLSLPFNDEVVFGLICNLVMQKAYDFVGTSGSTFTAYIQRNRNQSGLDESWKFFDDPDTSSTGPFSWNGYDLDPGRKMWWREWKESKLNV
jgi:hypothetical protein